MKFSVIICTYNYAHFLGDALRTVAAQTFSDFELLIVDDGSSDNTGHIVREFSDHFHNCRYLKKPHTGLADSRNFGIQAASGTHISFLDADDLWAPEYLGTVRAVFEETPQAELVCCDGFRVYGSGEVHGTLFPSGLPRVSGTIGTARDLFSFFPFVAPSAMAFAKSVYERVGPFDTTLPNGAEDWHWVIRTAQAGTFCVRVDRKMVIYRNHRESLTAQHADGMFLGWLQMYSKFFKDITDREVHACARRMTRRSLLRLLANYSEKEIRLLLRQGIDATGGDRLLEVAYCLTFFGLCYFAKSGKWIKYALRRNRRKGYRIDFSASPFSNIESVYGQTSS